ncbi:MAG: ribosome recycling factor [Candidatus Dependentiae bacterium]|nr:ribosome recycling factor [Candidatus Dependentiae bacterium]
MSHDITKSITLVENDIKAFQSPMEVEMQKAIKHFEGELIKIRTGRAHTSLVDSIPVSIYGQPPVAMKGVAAIAAPEANLITIQPWDSSTIADIEKALAASSIGISPVNDGKIIRLRVPQMSSQRRDELVKLLGKKTEECKIAMRNTRKDFNNLIRDGKTKKTISENFYTRLLDVLQNVTDAFTKRVDQMGKKKEEELHTI